MTRRLAAAAAAVLILGVLAYLAAVEISFRMLGNEDPGLSDEHRRLLDG